MFAKCKRWARTILQGYRDEYSEIYGPIKNRSERRMMAKMKKKRFIA